MPIATTAISASIILGSFSNHLSTEFAPTEGYNQQHDSIGIDLEYGNTGATAFYFKDSYGQGSHSILGNYGWRFGDELNAKLGFFTGYLNTSYYQGIYGGVFVEPCYNRLCSQISVVPKTDRTDAVVMMQFKIRLN